jgi:hypothetical protein
MRARSSRVLAACGQFRLQRKRRDQRNEVGVATALAEPVKRALDLPHARPHRRQRIGDGVFSVVVGVNAEVRAGDGGRDLGDDALDLVGKRAAVGVAKHNPARAGSISRPRAVERIGRVGLVAVEEMLAIDHRLAPCGDRRFDAVLDAGDVLI